MDDYVQKRVAIELRKLSTWTYRGGLRLNLRVKRPLFSFSRALLKVAGLYARGQQNAASPIVSHIDLQFPSLPAAFDGFRLLHLSDFHGECIPGLGDKIAATIRELEVDLCVLTGDYRQQSDFPCEDAYPILETVLPAVRSRHGIVGILGNVDSIDMIRPLENMGVRVLVNDVWVLEQDSASICWMGLDDPHYYGCDDLVGTVRRAPPSAFKVLLVHTPELVAEAEAHGIDLYLCGHTHGGQICLPGIGPIRRNATCDKRFLSGVWQFGRMKGFTTRGVGVTGVMVRFRCPPEIAVIRLLRGGGV